MLISVDKLIVALPTSASFWFVMQRFISYITHLWRLYPKLRNFIFLISNSPFDFSNLKMSVDFEILF